VRPRLKAKGSENWKRIRQNQDERFHQLAGAPINGPQAASLPPLFLDFKKTFTVPTSALYSAIQAQGVERVALIPPVFLQDLMHRYFGFHSRVGLPE
jgi:hypothetical protein